MVQIMHLCPDHKLLVQMMQSRSRSCTYAQIIHLYGPDHTLIWSRSCTYLMQTMHLCPDHKLLVQIMHLRSRSCPYMVQIILTWSRSCTYAQTINIFKIVHLWCRSYTYGQNDALLLSRSYTMIMVQTSI